MIIERKAVAPDNENRSADSHCLGCSDCTGLCNAYIHLVQYEQVSAGIREART